MKRAALLGFGVWMLGACAPAAGPASEPAGLEGITAEHNRIRATKGVGPLTWDPDLARIARDWANRCTDNEAPMGLVDHNPNRGDGYPLSVGENVYGTSGTASGMEAVTLWAAEEADYNYDTNTCASGKVCGHYTQVVWAASTKIGCAISQCAGLRFSGTVVCNYASAGNSGGRPY